MPGRSKFSGDWPVSIKKGKPSTQDKRPHTLDLDSEETHGRELKGGRVYGRNDDALAAEIAHHLEHSIIDAHNPGAVMVKTVPGGEKGNSLAPFEHSGEADGGLPAVSPHPGRTRGNQDKTAGGKTQSTKRN